MIEDIIFGVRILYVRGVGFSGYRGRVKNLNFFCRYWGENMWILILES